MSHWKTVAHSGFSLFSERQVPALLGYQEPTEDEDEDKQTGQYGKPCQPRALVTPYHGDQAGNPGG